MGLKHAYFGGLLIHRCTAFPVGFIMSLTMCQSPLFTAETSEKYFRLVTETQVDQMTACGCYVHSSLLISGSVFFCSENLWKLLDYLDPLHPPPPTSLSSFYTSLAVHWGTMVCQSLDTICHGLVSGKHWTIFLDCFLPVPSLSSWHGSSAWASNRWEKGGDGDVQSSAGDGGILPLCLPDSSEWQGAQLSMIPDESKL